MTCLLALFFKYANQLLQQWRTTSNFSLLFLCFVYTLLGLAYIKSQCFLLRNTHIQLYRKQNSQPSRNVCRFVEKRLLAAAQALLQTIPPWSVWASGPLICSWSSILTTTVWTNMFPTALNWHEHYLWKDTALERNFIS